MRGRRQGRLLLGMVPAVLLLVSGPAHPASRLATGWWTQAPIGLAPDAPSDGLVVEGGPDATPRAFAAVAYELTAEESPQRLTLDVAAGSLSSPAAVLAVCPVTAHFTPAQGGAMTEAPAFDCATTITASPAADEPRYEFDLSGLAPSSVVRLAILPTAATDRVVLAAPGPDSLQTTTASGSTAPSPGDTASDGSTFETSPSDTTSSSSSSGTSGSFDGSNPPSAAFSTSSPTFDDPPLPEPSTPEVAAPAAAGGQATAEAQTASTAQPAGAADRGTGIAGLALAGLVLAAAGLWLFAGWSAGQEAGAPDARRTSDQPA